MAEGEELRLVVPSGVQEDRTSISAWLAEQPQRSVVRWREDARAPVEWAVDARPWNLTTLVRHIIEQATAAPARTQVWGPNWFQTSDGTVLHKLAEPLADSSDGGRFDWSTLHAVLARLPEGRWTNGDLAAVVGTAAQPLGNHVAGCEECPNAQRILGADGRPRPTFAWSDLTDQRTQEEALAAETVPFMNGAADPYRRLGPSELNALLTA